MIERALCKSRATEAVPQLVREVQRHLEQFLGQGPWGEESLGVPRGVGVVQSIPVPALTRSQCRGGIFMVRFRGARKGRNPSCPVLGGSMRWLSPSWPLCSWAGLGCSESFVREFGVSQFARIALKNVRIF